MVSPTQHPNAFVALATGYVTSGLVYAATQLHITLTTQDAVYGATALITFALFLGREVKEEQAETTPATPITLTPESPQPGP